MWRVVVIGIGLTALLFVVAMGVLVVTALVYPEDYPDPFLPYDALMPGQPIADEQYDCQNQEIPSTVNRSLYCQMQQIEGLLCYGVVLNSDGDVHEIWFRGEGLVIGDIVYHWGWPEQITHDDRFFYLLWEQGLYAVVDPVGTTQQFDLLRHIEYLRLTNEPGLS